MEIISMADEYTVRTRTSYIDNVTAAFLMALFGAFLFFASFFVLWINEGRTNPATVARMSIAISSASVDASAEGKLVAATGTLASTEQLGDSSYVRPGNYLSLQRTVEMYAWSESRDTKTNTSVGGEKTSETTYRYEKKWTTSPPKSSSFEYSAGHENPQMPIKGETLTVRSASLGAYQVDPQALTLPDGQPLVLNGDNVQHDDTWRVSGEYLVNRENAINQPQVGDLRISYTMVPNNLEVTLFGKASGSQLVPFEAKGISLYRAFTENREQAISTLNGEYLLSLWLLRVGGFLMMWLGLFLGLGPISTMLDILPFLGSASRFITGASTFVVTLLLSLVTIIASIIAHNIFLLIGLLVLIVVAIVLGGRIRRPAMSATPA
jgi:hypothetical protein